jgi:hypothetical protein
MPQVLKPFICHQSLGMSLIYFNQFSWWFDTSAIVGCIHNFGTQKECVVPKSFWPSTLVDCYDLYNIQIGFLKIVSLDKSVH